MVSFGIGQAVRRVEDRRFLTGRGSYVDDIELPRQCHAVAVLSTHAHASIKRIDVAAARAAPGVALVLTGVDALAEDIGGIPPHFMPEHWGGPKGFGTLRPVLLADRVRCVGDRVAFVVAETEAQARDAAELVEVEYEPLPAVISLEDAVKPSAPKIWEDCPNGNSAVTISFGDKAATDAAFANAKYVVALRLENNRVTANAIEPRCAIGDVSGGRYTLYSTSQDPHGLRSKLAAAILHVPETKIRDVAQRRRWFRHEVEHLSRRRVGAVGIAPAGSSGEMDGDAQRLAAARYTGARPGCVWRARPRRRRQVPWAARQGLPGAGRLLVGRHHGAAVLFAHAHSKRLRCAGGRAQHASGLHQHRSDLGLSRRRAARGDLPDRAPDRPCRAGVRDRPGRDPTPQSDRAVGAALSHRHPSQLR